ncbi:toprim domain-containing protein [Rubinisphaera italica]|uniref:Toprim domain-containing protein n=1 Tax=Rubinisphaera italica TaxID=2527969 RepID=A0A5C5XCU7_9PLAN|nr:toprim domain-containing protein [Rubinisphaera italica]TWT60987.1 hypothetical protein Pan54_17190 [Rubinisphaera italica]
MKDVDTLIAETPVDQVLAHFGQRLTDAASGEHRMACVFNENCSESQYGNLTIKLDDPVNRIYCHSCGVRGNLLTLIHGLEHQRPPSGGKLRGDEFKDAVAKLREISTSDSPAIPKQADARPAIADQSPPSKPVNVPLVRHEKEAARKIADLCDDLIVDVAEMSPKAAEYVRSRPWMTPELLRKWGVGWIPGNGRSLFRKGYLVYTHRNERGEVVSYSGRDLSFEEKWEKWIRDGRPEGKKPGKHRFVQGFQKGLELYGGHSTRMNEEYVRESLVARGIVVVEGMNEVLRMESLGVVAVGLAGNKATDTQVETLIRYAHSVGGNRIILMPDFDEEGENAFKELLWQLAEANVDVKVGCSSRMFEGRFAGRQPEDLTDAEWTEIDKSIGNRV